MFIAIGGYLLYTFYKSPEDFKVAVEFARDHLGRSDGGALRQFDRILEGKPKMARQVSPLLKKKVAASQEWRCGHCKNLFDASYEVDHVVPLFKGGSNSESNLVALCRNCHGRKTVDDRLGFR
jgi:5-methylcytosine-specific restriction endonuclease McrA